MMEEKRKDSRTTFVGYGFSPAIATAVTFSFTYYERHKSLSAMIPTLQISTENFAIFMYDCCKDYLIGAIFEWTIGIISIFMGSTSLSHVPVTL